jgi:hypothetical protein
MLMTRPRSTPRPKRARAPCAAVWRASASARAASSTPDALAAASSAVSRAATARMCGRARSTGAAPCVCVCVCWGGVGKVECARAGGRSGWGGGSAFDRGGTRSTGARPCPMGPQRARPQPRLRPRAPSNPNHSPPPPHLPQVARVLERAPRRAARPGLGPPRARQRRRHPHLPVGPRGARLGAGSEAARAVGADDMERPPGVRGGRGRRVGGRRVAAAATVAAATRGPRRLQRHHARVTSRHAAGGTPLCGLFGRPGAVPGPKGPPLRRALRRFL